MSSPAAIWWACSSEDAESSQRPTIAASRHSRGRKRSLYGVVEATVCSPPHHQEGGQGGKTETNRAVMRAFAIWLVVVLVAVLNGGIRQTLISPNTGVMAAQAISTAMLCVAILAVCWLAIGWMRPTTSREAWRMGGLWVTLTIAFEFLAGHYLFGTGWHELFADYNVLRGRLWVIVLITTAAAPWLMAQFRGLVPRNR
jgi:hypothetical protein